MLDLDPYELDNHNLKQKVGGQQEQYWVQPSVSVG